MNKEIVTYLYARRAQVGASTSVPPRFRSPQEVPITELRTHPELIERVSWAARGLRDVQEGNVLGHYVLANKEGHIFALAVSMSFLALRVGSTVHLGKEGAVGESVEGLSEDWQAVDGWKYGTERLQAYCSLALEHSNTL